MSKKRCNSLLVKIANLLGLLYDLGRDMCTKKEGNCTSFNE